MRDSFDSEYRRRKREDRDLGTSFDKKRNLSGILSTVSLIHHYMSSNHCGKQYILNSRDLKYLQSSLEDMSIGSWYQVKNNHFYILNTKKS